MYITVGSVPFTTGMTDGPFNSKRDAILAAASTALGTIGYLLAHGTQPLGVDLALVSLCAGGAYGLAVGFDRTFDPVLDSFDRGLFPVVGFVGGLVLFGLLFHTAGPELGTGAVLAFSWAISAHGLGEWYR